MKRVVVTGMGLVTALGHTVEETWQALCAGRSGIGPIQGFDTSEYAVTFAGEVRDFDPSRYLERKEIRRTDPFTHFAVAASRQALAHAQLAITEQLAPEVGVCMGSGIDGLTTLYEQFAVLHEKGSARVSPFLVPMMMSNAAPGMVSLLTGARASVGGGLSLRDRRERDWGSLGDDSPRGSPGDASGTRRKGRHAAGDGSFCHYACALAAQ